MSEPVWLQLARTTGLSPERAQPALAEWHLAGITEPAARKLIEVLMFSPWP